MKVLVLLLLLTGCSTGVERAFEQCLVFGGSPKFERAGEAARVECQR